MRIRFSSGRETSYRGKQVGFVIQIHILPSFRHGQTLPKLAFDGQTLPKLAIGGHPCRSRPILAEAAVCALPCSERGCYTIKVGRLSGDHGKATSREVYVMGTKWSTRRFQVLRNGPKIVELLRKGETLPSIHTQLTESGDIDMALRTFRLYASEIRDMVRRNLEE